MNGQRPGFGTRFENERWREDAAFVELPRSLRGITSPPRDFSHEWSLQAFLHKNECCTDGAPVL